MENGDHLCFFNKNGILVLECMVLENVIYILKIHCDVDWIFFSELQIKSENMKIEFLHGFDYQLQTNYYFFDDIVRDFIDNYFGRDHIKHLLKTLTEDKNICFLNEWYYIEKKKRKSPHYILSLLEVEKKADVITLKRPSKNKRKVITLSVEEVTASIITASAQLNFWKEICLYTIFLNKNKI